MNTQVVRDHVLAFKTASSEKDQDRYRNTKLYICRAKEEERKEEILLADAEEIQKPVELSSPWSRKPFLLASRTKEKRASKFYLLREEKPLLSIELYNL